MEKNIVKIHLINNNIVTIPVHELPIFDFSLNDNQSILDYYTVYLRVSKITNNDNSFPFKYDYLKEVWDQLKDYTPNQIVKIEIIQDNNIIQTFENILKIYYKVDYLNPQLGEYLEIIIKKQH